MNLTNLTPAHMQFIVALVFMVVLGALLALERIPVADVGMLYFVAGWWLPSPAGPRPALPAAPAAPAEEDRNGR
ncbi:MAG: hypothetical protein NTZ05_12275 [Chloroflexi bacterium]|nr:hypothetical protein [Chloroflexota bacterium]